MTNCAAKSWSQRRGAQQEQQQQEQEEEQEEEVKTEPRHVLPQGQTCNAQFKLIANTSRRKLPQGGSGGRSLRKASWGEQINNLRIDRSRSKGRSGEHHANNDATRWPSRRQSGQPRNADRQRDRQTEHRHRMQSVLQQQRQHNLQLAERSTRSFPHDYKCNSLLAACRGTT